MAAPTIDQGYWMYSDRRDQASCRSVHLASTEVDRVRIRQRAQTVKALTRVLFRIL